MDWDALRADVVTDDVECLLENMEAQESMYLTFMYLLGFFDGMEG